MVPQSSVIITTVGTDRPGIVEELSQWLLQHGGNIEESRMAQLGGEFAALVLATGDADLHTRLEQTRTATEQSHALTISIHPVTATPAAPTQAHVPYTLTATALDHPGIVHRLSALLRKHSVNIVSAETGLSEAPFSAAPLFHVTMRLHVPVDPPVARLRAALLELSNTENIDTELTAQSRGKA